MNKQEAFEQLQEAIQGYNQVLEDFMSNLGNIQEVSEPYDIDDADDIDREFPSTYDIPSTYDLESAIDELHSAYQTFEEATSAYVVTFEVQVKVEAADESEAREKAEEVVGADQPLPSGAKVDVADVREADSTDRF